MTLPNHSPAKLVPPVVQSDRTMPLRSIRLRVQVPPGGYPVTVYTIIIPLVKFLSWFSEACSSKGFYTWGRLAAMDKIPSLSPAQPYRLVYCFALRARFKPAFFLSLPRESLVSNPFWRSAGLRLSSASTKARAMP